MCPLLVWLRFSPLNDLAYKAYEGYGGDGLMELAFGSDSPLVILVGRI
jgi:hypothetical protein